MLHQVNQKPCRVKSILPQNHIIPRPGRIDSAMLHLSILSVPVTPENIPPRPEQLPLDSIHFEATADMQFARWQNLSWVQHLVPKLAYCGWISFILEALFEVSVPASESPEVGRKFEGLV